MPCIGLCSGPQRIPGHRTQAPAPRGATRLATTAQAVVWFGLAWPSLVWPSPVCYPHLNPALNAQDKASPRLGLCSGPQRIPGHRTQAPAPRGATRLATTAQAVVWFGLAWPSPVCYPPPQPCAQRAIQGHASDYVLGHSVFLDRGLGIDCPTEALVGIWRPLTLVGFAIAG